MTKIPTALEKAMQRPVGDARDVIPPMTDELGKYWDQPARDLILIDDTHVVMSKAVFEMLKNYSHSIPTGVYPGKMWKCQVDYWSAAKGWLLCWFGEEFEKNGKMYCKGPLTREILIV